MARREELVESVTDYVLEHGLIGLSLRPMAAELGTSDRMLNYHFGSKSQLVADVMAETSRRSANRMDRLEPARSVADAVMVVWRALEATEQKRCQRVYVEAAALGLFGREPYASAVRRTNAVWDDSVRAYLIASGAPRSTVQRMVTLMEAAFMGFQLDLPLDDRDGVPQAVADLAAAIESLSPAG